MNCVFPHSPITTRARGFTLVEMLVAVGLGAIVLTVVATLFIFGLRSFIGLGNYAALSGQSRLAMDRMSRTIREATQVIDLNTNGPVKWLTVSNSMETPPLITRFSWDASTGILLCEETGQPTRTNLTGCDEWDFAMFQRAPTNNWVFYPTKDVSLCKLINMSWKCSRTILGQKVNTEDVLTAQIVLRNKP